MIAEVTQTEITTMTWQGWLFMAVAWSFVLGLFGYCLYRTFTQKDDSEKTDTAEAASSRENSV